MNRVLPIVLIVAALAVAFFLSRPRPAAQPTNPEALQVNPLTLEGTVAVPPGDVPVRVAAIAGGERLADGPIVDGQYKLELPATADVPLTDLGSISLLHGEGRLQGPARAAEISLLLYQDANRDGKYDLGEPKLDAAMLPGGSNPNLQAYFRYKILLLSNSATLNASEDNPTGAKNFYRYDIAMNRGYNILQGEFASNGYEMRAAQGTKWDLLLPLNPAGDGSPPAFTP
jgi:hypothetical protein